jgi:hypothetical protein
VKFLTSSAAPAPQPLRNCCCSSATPPWPPHSHPLEPRLPPPHAAAPEPIPSYSSTPSRTHPRGLDTGRGAERPGQVQVQGHPRGSFIQLELRRWQTATSTDPPPHRRLGPVPLPLFRLYRHCRRKKGVPDFTSVLGREMTTQAGPLVESHFESSEQQDGSNPPFKKRWLH